MGCEIERKFLVAQSKLPELDKGKHIRQGYIKTKGKSVVRLRVTSQASHITIKGPVIGISRSEFEYEIPTEEANEILNSLCAQPFIEKTRYIIKHSSHLWEIDVFHGLNNGLIVAEVELNSENEKIDLPTWVTSEVSGDHRYSNSNLCNNPFSSW